MSFRNVQQNSIENRNTLAIPIPQAARGAGSGWIRNPSWLPMPTITSANEEVTMLVPIYPDSNFIAFTFATSAGIYTVDWGDGNSGLFSSGNTAQWQYDFNTLALANTNAPVTFQQSGSTVTRTSHGYPNGYQISFASITTTTGIIANQIYYVINATTDTFQLASSKTSNTALTLTNDGTGIILPYKQAIIRVTPTTVGATFTSVNVNIKNSTTNLPAYVQPLMDLTISAACSSLTICNGTPRVSFRLLEKVTILRHNTTTFDSLFQGATALQSVNISNTANVTNMTNMFNGCNALTTLPLMDTGNVTTMNNMFLSCTGLPTIPPFNTAKIINMSSMFNNCASLTTLPLINTSNVANMNAMFLNCPSMVSIPPFNTANANNMSSMFNGCVSLQTVPLLDTTKVTNMNSMFNGCLSLQSIPTFNTANVTTTGMVSMFQGCSSLTTIPLLNTSNITDMTTMFNGCNSLQSIPLLDTTKVTSTLDTFTNCYALKTVPSLNTANVTNFNTMFSQNFSLQTIGNMSGVSAATMSSVFVNCPSLQSLVLNNIVVPFTVISCKLSGAALNNIYSGLGKVGGAVTFQGTPANTVTIVGHGYTGGESIRFSVITTTTGISTNTTYWVRNVTTDTFQLSATPTGAILTLTNNGTGTRASATITVSGNWGIFSDNPAIATAKGWTVTGS
jgi:surface protein